MARGKNKSTLNKNVDILWWVALCPNKRGSFEDYVVRVGNRCERSGLSFAVVFVAPCPADMVTWFNDEGIRFFEIKYSEIESTIEVARFLLKLRPQIIHFHYIGIGLGRALASRILSRKAVVVHDHSSRIHGELKKNSDNMSVIRRIRSIVLANLTDAIIAVSDYIREQIVLEMPAVSTKVITIHNGVDTTRFRKAADIGRNIRLSATPDREGGENVTIVFVGALEDYKGIREFLSAAEIIHGEFSDVRFLVVGNGSMAKFVVQRFKELGEHTAQYLGSRSDVHEILRTADILVGPSKWGEAFGLTFAEASASGLPIVSSRIGGIPEIVLDLETGFLCEPGDVDEIVGALRNLIGDSNLRTKMGVAGRARIEKMFELDDAVGKTMDLYIRLGVRSCAINSITPIPKPQQKD